MIKKSGKYIEDKECNFGLEDFKKDYYDFLPNTLIPTFDEIIKNLTRKNSSFYFDDGGKPVFSSHTVSDTNNERT